MLSSIALLLPALSLVAGLGDFLCADTLNPSNPNVYSCADWSNNVPGTAQGPISPTAVCQPDPANLSTSYCGYAGAACTTNLDCDYGSCSVNGTCAGYFGAPCPGGVATGSSFCQGYLFCGSDNTCGGVNAACNNVPNLPHPNGQCSSGSCVNGTSGIPACTAVASVGLAIGKPCASSTLCGAGDLCVIPAGNTTASTSSFNSTTFNTCQAKVAPSAVPSGTLSKKVKRYVLNGSGPNSDTCAKGLQECAVGLNEKDGFECIDAKTNLEKCGGCVLDGEGADCTAIPGIEGVNCQSGHCVILSCRPGLEISTNGHSCVTHV